MSDLSDEFEAMEAISNILENMDNNTRARVVNWAVDKFTVGPRVILPANGGAGGEESETASFSEFVDLYDRVDPSDQMEKVLTAAYWFQVIKSEASWQAQDINSTLKDTGNGVTSIAHVFERAQAKKPALVRQIVKSGKTRQARKTYKLTSAGIKFIVNRLNQPTKSTYSEEGE